MSKESVAAKWKRKAIAPPVAGHGGSWSRYFENKASKLRTQFAEEQVERFDLPNEQTSSVFAGVTIFVNGHTVPSQQELKHLMALHGGGFEIYDSRPPVTHVVCSNLPLAKLRQLRKQKRPVPVVRPEWITASVEAGRRLPIGAFLLEQLRDAQTQRLEEQDGDAEDGNAERELAYFRDAALTPEAFVRSYFQNSRLHFIGTWKMRIEAFATQRRHAGPKLDKTSLEREIVHVDMDCFFASVAVLSRPELKDVPFVVCHSQNADGTAEVSCANYPARALGIGAGSFISSALEKCPTLQVVPYEFQKYQEISEQVYGILLRRSSCVEPVSCDEAYLDVTGLGDAEALLSKVRAEIFAATRCPASGGIGPNKLLAKMATSVGKPNGQFRLRPSDVAAFLSQTPLDRLPGVGWSLLQKLEAAGIRSVAELRECGKETLCSEFGQKTGCALWEASRGIDRSPVQPPKGRKSVSAECNWGIRLKEHAEAKCYLREILAQVLHRMSFLRLKGRCITLKVRTRQEDAPVVPRKFLGCGACDHHTRSQTLDAFTDDEEVLMEQLWKLFLRTDLPVHEIRGLGVTVSKLNCEKEQSTTLPPLLKPNGREAPEVATADVGAKRRCVERDVRPRLCPASGAVRVVQPDGLVLADVDPSVLAALPTELRKEIVETIPLRKGALFVAAEDASDVQERKPPIPWRRSPPPDGASLAEIVGAGYEATLPTVVASRLRRLLRNAEDVVVWTERQRQTTEPVLALLWEVHDWADSVDELHLEQICHALKAVRRIGRQFPRIFAHCSDAFLQSVQRSVETDFGWTLDLTPAL